MDSRPYIIYPTGDIIMKIYFAIFLVTLMIGIISVLLGIVLNRKLNPWITIAMILCGIFISFESVCICLCLGFFMR